MEKLLSGLRATSVDHGSIAAKIAGFISPDCLMIVLSQGQILLLTGKRITFAKNTSC